MTDEGFDQGFGPGRGSDRPEPREKSALDIFREAVAELNVRYGDRSPPARMDECDMGVEALMRERGIRLGDGYFVNSFGGSVSRRGHPMGSCGR